MHAIAHSTQVFSMFGGGYVSEQRTDEMQGYLAPSDINAAVASLTALMFSDVMQSLRTALSIKPGQMA